MKVFVTCPLPGDAKSASGQKYYRELAVTNLDGLDTVKVIKVCIGYRVGKTRYDYVPTEVEMLSKCEPVYAEFEGWCTPTSRRTRT